MRFRPGKIALIAAVVVSYLFLYLPIVHIGLASLSRNSSFPYPPHWSFATMSRLLGNSLYQTALGNSLLLGVLVATLSTALAGAATIGLMRHAGRKTTLFLALFIAPLFVAEVLLGISSLIFSGLFLGLQGNLGSAVLANVVHCFSYALLIMATQLYRYDWRLDDAAMVFGATPARTFFEVTLPLIWPGLLGAFIVTFIMAFNNLEISFYLLGATPTLPSVAWGALRYGVKPELYALATCVNLVVLCVLAVMFVLMRTGLATFGHRPERERAAV
ncbi:ABC transporter permease [Methylopila sp. Yamaguchi]|uniref:ABC transporter permease n=1 Tax=Methylopila sp. Yamaguchi TaxID=1437817 RepID=UPI000CC89E32|nr:ABC transporter permease subunit [Methylopila sp. Yamaguchi]GBD46928.1 binding-protein-dependent transporters inner membrane component [Methylopila sp. Yamaguchi]